MKEKEIDKDTVIAYHDFVQTQIRGELNGIFLGPGRFYAQIAVASFLSGLVSAIVGILVITLRRRHVYLISWDDQFLGPFFIILAFMLVGFAAALVVQAKRRANAYRRDLVVRLWALYFYSMVVHVQYSFNYKWTRCSPWKFTHIAYARKPA